MRSQKDVAARYMPYAFTEHGALMAATALNTPLAVDVSLQVVCAFVRLRAVLAENQQLAPKRRELEHRVGTHDAAIADIVEAIRRLMASPSLNEKRPIGFAPWEDDG